MNRTGWKALINRNAAMIRKLKHRFDEAYKHRSEGPEQAAACDEAREAFQRQYGELAVPNCGYYRLAREKLRAGDPHVLEWALCFLECRPYFDRSGFMYKDLMRVLKNVPMGAGARSRFERMRQRYLDFLESRKRNDCR